MSDLTSRAQGEAERLRPVTGVADDTERRGNLLWGAGYVTGATWAAAQAPSVEALTAEVERLVGLSQSNASAFERAYDAMSAAQAQLDRLQAGIKRVNLHHYLPDPNHSAQLCEDDDCLWWDMTYALQADLRALLAEDET